MGDRTLEQAIGGELKRLRDAAHARQEAVALAGQQLGLDWSQSTIAGLEAGRRGLSIGELVLLPEIVHKAGLSPRRLRVMDMIPASNERVGLAGGSTGTLRFARYLLGDRSVHRAALPPPTVAHRLTLGAGRMTTVGGRALVTESERKASRKLGCTTQAIQSAAQALWGRTLNEERDARLGAAVDDPPRTLQAKRGRVTVALTRELAEPITAWRKAKHGRRQ